MKLLRHLKNLIETNRFFSLCFDIIAHNNIYRKIVFSRINKITTDLKKSKEYNIIIETTNFCNARCIMCPHISMKRHQAIMDNQTFEKIIHQIKTEKINPVAIILNGFGEPLIDSQIINRIKLIKQTFPTTKVKFYSNFNLANKKLISQLISSKLDEINISLNGYSRQNYQKVMKIDYQKTIKNIQQLIIAKKEKKSDIKIRISMTLVEYNETSANKFIKKWEKQVDSVSVNKVHDYHGNVKDTSHKFKINFHKKPFPCRYLWDTIVFDVTGENVLCCLDYESDYKFGNIKDMKILKTFYSPSIEAIRKSHLQGNLKQINICQNCYTPYKNGVEWLINKLY